MLRANAMKDFYRQQLIHHADKLGDAQIVVVNFGQQFTHQRVKHSLHRCQ